MSWNKHSAVIYARQHAQQQSSGFCARAVAAAIEAGVVRITGANAVDFDRSLERAGFR